MLKKLKVRITLKDAKDPEKEITQYADSLVNLDQISSAFESGVPGTILVKMANKDTHLIKGTIGDLLKSEGSSK